MIAYTFCYDLIGEEIHKWVGEEASGHYRWEPKFDNDNHPHNPLTDAGGIILCALIIRANKTVPDILKYYKKITLTKKVEIDFELANKFKIISSSDMTLMNLMLANN